MRPAVLILIMILFSAAALAVPEINLKGTSLHTPDGGIETDIGAHSSKGGLFSFNSSGAALFTYFPETGKVVVAPGATAQQIAEVAARELDQASKRGLGYVRTIDALRGEVDRFKGELLECRRDLRRMKQPAQFEAPADALASVR